MPTREDLSPELADRLEGVEVRGSWTEILQQLDRIGPATTGEITEHVSLSSTEGVRKAVYGLMSLDQREQSIDERIVVKDRIEETYGLPRQIPEQRRARNWIPLDPMERRSRILDELVRRLYDALPDSLDEPEAVVAEVVDRDPQQTRAMHRRAQAFDFPFSRWAAYRRSHHTSAATIEAIDAIAAQTDNVSSPLLGRTIADALEQNDEPQLADLLRTWADGDLDEVTPERTSSGMTAQEQKAAILEAADAKDSGQDADPHSGRVNSTLTEPTKADEDGAQYPVEEPDSFTPAQVSSEAPSWADAIDPEDAQNEPRE